MTQEELARIKTLSIELLEITAVVGQKLLDFADRNNIAFPERYTLGHLLRKATLLLHDIYNDDSIEFKSRKLPFRKDDDRNPEELPECAQKVFMRWLLVCKK